MQAIEVVRFVRTATSQLDVDVRYLKVDGTPYDGLPPDLAEEMEAAEGSGA
jgi:hypothetical protein